DLTSVSEWAALKPSFYLLFFETFRDLVLLFKTGCVSPKTMSPKEKGKFEDMAKQDKLRYEREMKNYVPPKGQKKKRFKDPNAPKRPPYVSAFFLFCADFRPKIKSENPGLSIGDTAKKLGEMWNSSSAEEKQPYEKKAAKLKEKYDKVIIQNDYHLVIFSPHRSAFFLFCADFRPKIKS
uniref:HMG box domain-containing protein n=1 Tax=Pundamilia nyererei TaxID=303518 RepID=A0A3B4FYW9_9CICH